MVITMKKSQNLLRFYGDTDFITGLRAIAATMVVMIHTGAFNDFGAMGQAITSAGKYGVDIFFVISGFTIAKTFIEAVDYRSYLTRRIMRIMPLYWVMIVIATLFWLSDEFSQPYWMQKFGSEPDIYNLLMHLSMISYFDYRIANSLLGVEWSIPIEVFWYVFLPIIVSYGRTISKVVGTILFLLILTATLSYISKQLLGTSLPIRWSPIAYGHLFFLGVVSYHLRTRFNFVTVRREVFWLTAAVAMFILALIFEFDGRSEILALCTAVLIIFAKPTNAKWITKPLTVRPVLFIGSISYSIYLIHMLVIHIYSELGVLPETAIWKFVVVYTITIILSTVTYVVIEKPTNHLGRLMVERRS